MKLRNIYCILLCILIKGTAIQAQTQIDTISSRYGVNFELLSPEKVYLHTDRDVYNAGDTIWVKGYLRNKSYSSEYQESNYIYIELTGTSKKTMMNYRMPNEQEVLFRAKIKRDENGFSGYIPLKEEWLSDRYYVRAYTHWMLNGDSEYIFKKEIGIVNVLKDMAKERLDSSSASSNYYAYEQIGLSVPVRDRKEERYDYDIQFLPESGVILSGYPSVIGIKSVNSSGEGVYTSGKIYNSKIEMLGEFTTNDIGMGSISLPPLSYNDKLMADIIDKNGIKKTVNLPVIRRSGAAINYQNQGGDISVNIFVSEDLSPDKLSVIFHNGSEIYLQRGVNRNITKLKLSDSELTEGIHSITLLNDKYEVLAQRVFFVFDKTDIVTDISTDIERLRRRSEVNMSIKLTDEHGVPVNGDFSVSVIDNIVDRNNSIDNIESYMLLSSELTGYVEDPQRYFRDSIPYEARLNEIDYLMLTQGWRYYEPQLIISGNYPMPRFGREYNQSLAGRVMGLFKEPKNSMVSITAHSINLNIIGELGEGGRFVVEDINYPEGTGFLVSAYNRRGRGRGVAPILENDAFAPLVQYYSKPSKIEYSDAYREETLISQLISGNDLAIELDASVITSSRITLKNNPTPIQNISFKRDQVRTEDDMKPYEDMDIFTYVSKTFPGVILAYSSETSNGRILTTSRKSRISSQMSMSTQGDFPIDVYINRVRSEQEYLEHYLVSDIETMVYTEDSISEIFNPSRGEGGSFQGTGVLFIMLKKESISRPNIVFSQPLGWQKRATFYAPKYQRGENPVFATDLRYTIHWDPFVKCEDGDMYVRFFASDRINTGYRIVIEGVTKEGNYYSHMEEIVSNK